MAVWSVVQIQTALGRNRLDAEFFQPSFLAVERQLERAGATSLASLLSDVRYGLNIPAEYVEEGLRFLRALNLKEYGISGEILCIPYTVGEVGETNLLKDGDLLIVRSGANVGDTGIATARFAGSTFGSYVIRMRVGDIDPYYLYVFLKSRLGRAQTVRFRSGSAQPNISIPNLREISVFVASPADQQRVRQLLERSEAAAVRAEEALADAEGALLKALGLASLDTARHLFYERHFSALLSARRFDAEYFSPRYQGVLDVLGRDGRAIGDVATLAERRFRPGKSAVGATFHYIEIGSVGNNGVADSETVESSEAPSRAQWIVEPGDIITSTVRPIRRLSALITPEQSGFVCSSGFAVLRPNDGLIEPEVLLTFLRLPIICEILDLHTTASMYPAISAARLLELPIGVPSAGVRGGIVQRVRAALAARAQAARLLEDAKADVEAMVLRGRK